MTKWFNHLEILAYPDDEEKMIVRCNNCGQAARYWTETRMISGYVGCDNTIPGTDRVCYWDDLVPRVIHLKAHDYETYRAGLIYRWRDGYDGV